MQPQYALIPHPGAHQGAPARSSIPTFVWVVICIVTITLCIIGAAVTLAYLKKEPTPAAVTTQVATPVLTPEAYASIQKAIDKLADTDESLTLKLNDVQDLINRNKNDAKYLLELAPSVNAIAPLISEVNKLKAQVSEISSKSPSQDVAKLTSIINSLSQQLSDLSSQHLYTKRVYDNQQEQIKKIYDALNNQSVRTSSRTAPAQPQVAPQQQISPNVEPVVLIDETTGRVRSNTPLTPEMLRSLLEQANNQTQQTTAQADPTDSNSRPVPLPDNSRKLWGQ